MILVGCSRAAARTQSRKDSQVVVSSRSGGAPGFVAPPCGERPCGVIASRQTPAQPRLRTCSTGESRFNGLPLRRRHEALYLFGGRVPAPVARRHRRGPGPARAPPVRRPPRHRRPAATRCRGGRRVDAWRIDAQRLREHRRQRPARAAARSRARRPGWRRAHPHAAARAGTGQSCRTSRSRWPATSPSTAGIRRGSRHPPAPTSQIRPGDLLAHTQSVRRKRTGTRAMAATA